MSVPFLDLKNQYMTIKPEVEKKVLEVLESCSYINGKYVREFEKNIESFLHVKHSIGCSSGTAALMLALKACDVKPGDEVITTAFSFFATAEAIAAVGAIPVFVDIREDDYNINAEEIEKAITNKTKAILPVHIFGACCDMDHINSIANNYGLRVIEDCAQAIGATYKNRNAGTMGDVGCFSFYPTKNLGCCGDGGMVITNNDDIELILKAFREHGGGKNGAFALEKLEGIHEEINTSEEVTELYDPYKYFNYLIAYNSRLDAIQAAVLDIKLKYLKEYNSKRRSIAVRYMEGLDQQIVRPKYNDDQKSCWHQFVVRTKYKNELCRFLGEKGIGNGTFYPVPLHKQKAFNNSNCKNPNARLPIAELVSSQSVCLPIFPEMTDEQVDEVINTVNMFYSNRK